MSCTICDSEKETRHYSLYVNGSEGVNLCQVCQISVCKYIRDMQNLYFKGKRDTYKQMRKRGKL